MTNSTTAPLVKTKLSIMMFLQYAIWGAWLPLLWPFLAGHRQFEPGQIGDMFAVGALGALLAPFIAGQIADRYFPTEKFLGISHILGGILIWQLAILESYGAFLAFSFFYSVIYSPTLPLTNSLAFHHLPDRDRDFGKVRVWGTVGWIFAGLTIGQWLAHQHTPPNLVKEAERTALVAKEAASKLPAQQASINTATVDPALKKAAEEAEVEAKKAAEALRKVQVAGMADAFRLSGIMGIIMGLFCFVLPHTPPSKEQKSYAAGAAFKEILHNPRLIALFSFSLVVSCIHQFYFVHASSYLGTQQSKAADTINSIFGVGGGGLMTIGQMSEILVLAGIPMVAKTLSRKSLLATGLVAYALRMFLFAYAAPISTAIGVPMVTILMAGVALHGFCFGCFIFVAFMIVDEETTGDVRASAQSLYNFVIVGVGMIVGSKIAASVAAWAGPSGSPMDYSKLFSVPMYAAIATLAALLVFYPSGKGAPVAAPAGVSPEPAEKA